MKLLFVAPSAYTLGGVQDWLSELIPGLREIGHHVVVAIPNDDHHNQENYNKFFPHLSTVSFSNQTGSALGRVKSLIRLLRAYPDHQVVSVNIGDLYNAVRFLRQKRQFHTRLIITLHALEAEYYSDIKNNSDIIDAVIATNKLSCAILTHQNINLAQRVFYSPYGVTIPSLPEKRPAPLDILRIAWIGRFEQSQKRIHDLVEILTNLDQLNLNYTLTLAGDGPEKRYILTELSHWISNNKVSYIGRISKQELHDCVFSSHHALLITSSWETGPIVAWEAMASYLVVVSSRYIGMGLEGALKEDQTALLFNTGDTQAAAQQLVRLTNQDVYNSIATRAHTLVRYTYSKASSTANWDKTFQQINTLPMLTTSYSKAHFPQHLPPAGRLDRILGIYFAEHIRKLLGLRFKHPSPGSEWPHSLNRYQSNEVFLEQVAELDKSNRQFASTDWCLDERSMEI